MPTFSYDVQVPAWLKYPSWDLETDAALEYAGRADQLVYYPIMSGL